MHLSNARERGKISLFLVKDGHSAELRNRNPLSIARACPLFLHMGQQRS